MQHRAEVDGLRTVAVMPVLLGHAGFPAFSGGHVGVDVFFVIRGYLITGIILRGLDAGDFSQLDFYNRRVRRILPPLFVVMLASIASGFVLMSADAYQNLGQSVVATTLFSNNILLTVTSGYWETESQFKPLLHTWSLGVEEQYYVLVPLLLIALHRLAPRHIPGLLLLLAGISLALAIWSIQTTPVATFYLLHTRIWELAIGGWAVATPRLAERNSDPLAWLGLVMIGAAVLLLPEGTPTPSFTTLLPVVGTVLVLVFCRTGSARALLASAPMVGIGLISYSVYLWHQPLYAFARVASHDRPTPAVFALLILASLVLGWLSWRFIEQPFRNRTLISNRALVAILLPSSVGLIAAGLAMHLLGGLPQRFDVAPGAEPAGTYKRYNMAPFELKLDAFDKTAARRVLVVGNSTARDVVNMLLESGTARRQEIVYRDDLDLCAPTLAHAGLIRDASLVAFVHDSGFDARVCDGRRLAERPDVRGKIVFIGPKHFGLNLNPYARLPLNKRGAARVRIPDETLFAEARYAATTPPSLYLSIIGRVSADGSTLPIFDEAGRILSEDRVHVTRAGARYLGDRVFDDPVWTAAWPAIVDRRSPAR